MHVSVQNAIVIYNCIEVLGQYYPAPRNHLVTRYLKKSMTSYSAKKPINLKSVSVNRGVSVTSSFYTNKNKRSDMSAERRPPGFSWRSMEESVRRRAVKNAARLAAARASRSAVVVSTRGIPAAGIQRLYGRPSTQEIKFFDCPVTAPSGATFGLPAYTKPPSGGEPGVAFTGITELNCIPQGATSYNRIGTKIVIKSIKFDTTFMLAGTAPSSATVRWMLVYDRQPNGAFPAFSSLLSSNISTVPGMYTGVNMANRSRFLVLRDQVVALDNTQRQIYHASAYIRTTLETQYSGTTSTIGDITTGAVYLVAFVNGADAANYVAMVATTSRIRYID